MKKKLTFLCSVFLLSLTTFSQTIKIPLSKGGTEDGGTILQVNVNNGNYVATNLEGLISTNEEGHSFSTIVATAFSRHI